MDGDIIEILEYNLLAELKRKELDKKQKAELLKDYMERTGTSLRELARELNVPHTTLFYWANEEKREEHIQTISSSKARKELDFLVESLSMLLSRIENHKIKLKNEDRVIIERIKDISHKIFLLTRTVKI